MLSCFVICWLNYRNDGVAGHLGHGGHGGPLAAGQVRVAGPAGVAIRDR